MPRCVEGLTRFEHAKGEKFLVRAKTLGFVSLIGSLPYLFPHPWPASTNQAGSAMRTIIGLPTDNTMVCVAEPTGLRGKGVRGVALVGKMNRCL